MCTKHSNPLSINLVTHQKRKLHINLKPYYLNIAAVPRIQDLLKTIIPCSGNVLVGLQLINDGIIIHALPILVIHKEKRSWRICIGNRAVKIRLPTFWRGIFGRSQIYFGMNLKSSAQWITNEKVGKYETEFHAIARIYQWNLTFIGQSVTS